MRRRLLVGLGVSAAILWLGSAGLYWWGVGASTADLVPGLAVAPTGTALLAVSPADVVVGAVKRAEGDGSIVIRLLETAGKAATARLELASILGWLARPDRTGGADRFVVPEARREVVLAYERDGKPMTGREGLIQLVVGADEFASRYSHWVSEVRVR